jgi:membrane protein
LNLKTTLYKFPIVKQLIALLKKTVLPGFEGVSLFLVIKFFLLNLNNVNLGERSAAVTFNFITALPPTLLFFFTLVPYLPMENVHVTILTSLRLIIPNEETYHSISSVINDFLNKERAPLLSFSLLMSLFFSSNGMMSLIYYFDRDLKLYVARGAIRKRLAAIKLTLVLIAVVLMSIVVLILQSEILNEWILILFNNLFFVKSLSLLILFFIIFSAISIIYIYGPSLTHRFRFFSAGALFATLMCIVSTVVFFYLVDNFLNYDKVYGSLGTLIAFLAWISLNTKIIMLGYDLNVSILSGKIFNEEQLKLDQKKV